MVSTHDIDSLTKDEIREVLNLPLKIYGTLTFVGYTADNEIAIYFTKHNRHKLLEQLKTLRQMTGREVFIHIDEGNWSIKPQEGSRGHIVVEEISNPPTESITTESRQEDSVHKERR